MRPRPLAMLFALTVPVLLGLSRVACAGLDLQCLQTKTMRVVYYDPAHAYIIPHLARCFENSCAYYHRALGYVPGEEVTILLQDFDDYGYAGTSTIPNNYITLGIEPFRREVINWGGQVDFRLVIFSALESTLSIGGAAAKEEGRDLDSEFIISLKIM